MNLIRSADPVASIGRSWKRITCRSLLCISVFLVASSAMTSQAQNASKGTIYSRYGLGERITFSSPRSQAIGGGGLAFRSANGTNFANPATLSDIFFARFTAGMIMQKITESATGFEDSKLSAGYLTAIQFSFPLIAGKLGAGISSTPFTRVAYRVDGGGTFEVEPGTDESVPFQASFNGNGGLQKISPVIGYALTPKLSVGASVDFIFGILEDVQNISFGNAAFEDGLVTEATRLSTVSGTFGVWYRSRHFLKQGDGIFLGATLSLPSSLSGKRIVSTGQGEFVDTLATLDVRSVGLPLRGSLSIAYQQSSRLTIAVDGVYEGWSDTSSDVSFPGFPDDGGNPYNNRYRFSGGFEYGGGGANASFWRRVLLRFGVYFDQSYVSPRPETDINTLGLTGGISIPTLFPGTTLDINFDIGKTGTTDNGLVRDRYFKLGVNLSFAERWFQRIKLN